MKSLIPVLVILLILIGMMGCIYNNKQKDCANKGAAFVSTHGTEGFCVKDGKILP